MYWFSDGTCPGCRIALFMVDHGADEPNTARSHSHSEDEIIHVLDGELHVGPQTVTAGMSMAIPKNVRYSFRSKGRYRFINYRSNPSFYIGRPNSEPVRETRDQLLKSVAGAD
jgi:hypothetical protein